MTRRVPFVDLRRLVDRVREDALRDWDGVLDRCELVLGPTVRALEARLAEILGVAHVVACNSGTDALRIAPQAAELAAGASVALPNLTFWASYEAPAQLGHPVVLLDVDPTDLHVDLEAVRAAHDRHRFAALILPHLFGWTSHRLADLRALCRARDIALIEDAAQAFGVEVAGRPLLADADVATLSFFPAKVVGGVMDGGAIVTRDADVAARARALRDHGRTEHFAFDRVGWNSRMGGLQASWLLRVLEHLPFILGTRRAALARYADALASAGGARLVEPPPGVLGNGYLAVALCDDGAAFAEALGGEGIGTSRAYPTTIADQPGARGAIVTGALSRSRAFCRAVVDLPLFAGITAGEVDEVVAAVGRVARGRTPGRAPMV